MNYNPFDLVMVRINGVEIEGRPYEFDSPNIDEQAKPTHVSTVCPTCGQGVMVENIALPDPPFPVIDWSCKNCNPGIEPQFNAFMNPLDAGRIEDYQIDPLLHNPDDQVVDSEETVAERMAAEAMAESVAAEEALKEEEKLAAEALVETKDVENIEEFETLDEMIHEDEEKIAADKAAEETAALEAETAALDKAAKELEEQAAELAQEIDELEAEIPDEKPPLPEEPKVEIKPQRKPNRKKTTKAKKNTKKSFVSEKVSEPDDVSQTSLSATEPVSLKTEPVSNNLDHATGMSEEDDDMADLNDDDIIK